jgi:glycosyltransferase involved in cell wall biosynthesis
LDAGDRAVRFSVLVPAHNEEAYLGACLASIEAAAGPYEGQVETIVALNRCNDRTEEIARSHGAAVVREDARNLARIRNCAARAACGEILVTIDADSTMSANMLSEIDRALARGDSIGGGVPLIPARLSPGIVLTWLMLAPYALIRYRVSAGLFWSRREDFEAIGGFDETMVSGEDLDFALRLKAYGKAHGKRFKTLWGTSIHTSCRKFDAFGDWYLVLRPGLIRTILRGKDQNAADRYYYDLER